MKRIIFTKQNCILFFALCYISFISCSEITFEDICTLQKKSQLNVESSNRRCFILSFQEAQADIDKEQIKLQEDTAISKEESQQRIQSLHNRQIMLNVVQGIFNASICKQLVAIKESQTKLYAQKIHLNARIIKELINIAVKNSISDHLLTIDNTMTQELKNLIEITQNAIFYDVAHTIIQTRRKKVTLTENIARIYNSLSLRINQLLISPEKQLDQLPRNDHMDDYLLYQCINNPMRFPAWLKVEHCPKELQY